MEPHEDLNEFMTHYVAGIKDRNRYFINSLTAAHPEFIKNYNEWVERERDNHLAQIWLGQDRLTWRYPEHPRILADIQINLNHISIIR